MKVWVFYGQLPKTKQWVLLKHIVSSENKMREFIENESKCFRKIYPLMIKVPHPDLVEKLGGKEITLFYDPQSLPPNRGTRRRKNDY